MSTGFIQSAISLLHRLTLTAEPFVAQAETDVLMMLQDSGQLVVSETSQCFQLSLSASFCPYSGHGPAGIAAESASTISNNAGSH